MKETRKDSLNIKIYSSRAEMGKGAAMDIKSTIMGLLANKDEINMIFAAAPSQNEVLAELAADKDIQWGRINAYHMDEYIGLPSGAPQAFGNFLRDRLFALVPFKSVNYIDASATDSQKECERYSAKLLANRPDIVVMGIGENGHIAFNDPHVALFDDKETVKAVALDPVCRQQQVNDGCFASLSEVPEYALTLTIPTLINTDNIFCIVPAPTKAWAVNETVTGKVDEHCPASILRTHKNATLYLDPDSSSLLQV